MMPMMKMIDEVGGDDERVTGGLTKYLVYTKAIGVVADKEAYVLNDADDEDD